MLALAVPPALLWSVSLPPETKLKKYMKAIGKEAAAGCALRHRERRAYVREQVKALAALVGAEPGMLGPKLPMVRGKTEERGHRRTETEAGGEKTMSTSERRKGKGKTKEVGQGMRDDD